MKKKILFLSFYDINGGAGIAAYKSFTLIPKTKCEADFFCVKKYSNDPDVSTIKISFFSIVKIFLNILVSKILFFVFPLKNKQKRSLCIFNTGLLNNVDHSKYDIVHFHWLFNEFISIDEILSIKKKLIISAHDLWLINGSTHYNPGKINSLTRNFEKYLKKKKIEKLKKRKDLTITTPSVWSKSLHHNEINKNVKNVKNLNISILKNVPYLINGLFKENIRNKYFLPKNEVLTLINVNKKNKYIKGYDLLEKILDKLDKLNEIKYFLIFGNGTNEIPFHKYKNLIFLNFGLVKYSEMHNLYSMSDITLLPSRQETFSQIVSESLAFNIPVITFDYAAQVELFKHKVNGYKANSFDTNDFVKGIFYFYQKKNHQVKKIKILPYSKNDYYKINLKKIYD